MVKDNLSDGSSSKSVLADLLGVSVEEVERVGAVNDARREAYNDEISEIYKSISPEERAEIVAENLAEYDEVFGSAEG